MDLARYALERLGVDENGFDSLDRKFLNALVVQFSGGPVGVDTLASAIGEESDTLENVVEPYLIQEGFVQRTPRGAHRYPACFSLFGCSAAENTGSIQRQASRPVERRTFSQIAIEPGLALGLDS